MSAILSTRIVNIDFDVVLGIFFSELPQEKKLTK